MVLEKRGSWALAVAVAAAGDASAQTVLWSVNGAKDRYSTFGVVTLLDDVDGDGVREVLTGDVATGDLYAYSGATGFKFWQANATAFCAANFPYQFVACDFEGDGIPEVVANDPNYDNCSSGNDKGYYEAFDGRDGSHLYYGSGDYTDLKYRTIGAEGGAGVAGVRHWWTNKSHFLFSWTHYAIDGLLGGGFRLKAQALAISGIGDLDGDLRSEIAVLSSELEIFSPGAGVRLGSIAVPATAADRFIARSAGGDHDGDGINDILVSSVLEDGFAGPDSGAAYLYSGAAGFPLLWRQEGAVANAQFGVCCDAGDVDGDGTPDFTIGAPGNLVAGGPDGEVLVYSGKTRYVLARFRGRCGFGCSLAGGEDLNGDAIPDLVVGTFHDGGSVVANVTAYALDRNPVVVSVTPDRARWDSGATITIEGANFRGPGLVVEVGGVAAGNVQIASDSRVTCDLPIGVTGPADVTVRSTVGSGSLAAALRWTPAILVEGDDTLGGDATVRVLLDRNDEAWGFWSIGPATPVATPPYHFDACVFGVSTQLYFVDPAALGTELLFQETIPLDPTLVGTEFLVQALVGPRVTTHPKEAAWTNCGSLLIR